MLRSGRRTQDLSQEELSNVVDKAYVAWGADAAGQRSQALSRQAKARQTELQAKRAAYVKDAYAVELARFKERANRPWQAKPPDAISYPSVKRLSGAELLHLRDSGRARLSSTEPLVLRVGLHALRHNELWVAPWQMTCTLQAFFSVLARSPQLLGVAKCEAVKRNGCMGYRMLSHLLLEQRSGPAGAVVLQRGAAFQPWEVVRLQGCWLLSGWKRRGGLSLSHCIGVNAGAGIVFLCPEVVVVEEADRIHLDRFAAYIDETYGIYLTDTCKIREVMVNPAHSAVAALPCNTGWTDPMELKAAKERAAKRKRGARGGKGKRKGKHPRPSVSAEP